MKEAYDVVIIGSGFGGAVTGCRLAEAGYSVCILERGKRWKKSEFPRSASDMRNLFWTPVNPKGLIDYGTFSGMDVIRGTGVGGGSLVYFNVQLETPPRIFEKGWPKDVNRSVLDPYYDKVRTMLEAKPLTPPEGTDMLPRTRAFMKAAKKTGHEPRLLNIAVYTGEDRKNPVGQVNQSGCVYCSNNLLGCHVHAKNTLDLNYIPRAESKGAEVFPLHMVDKIEPSKKGYKVTYRELTKNKTGSVNSKKLIVAAGTLGTNELLLKCKDVFKTLPDLSPMLGKGYSGNGDFLLEGTWNSKMYVDATEGPSITAVADFSSAKHSIHIEDLGFPDALAWYLEGALPEAGRIIRSIKFGIQYLLQALNLVEDNRVSSHLNRMIGQSRIVRFLPYLGMGTDAADGVMSLKKGQIHIHWDSTNSMDMFNEMEKHLKSMSKAIGGKYITSPIWLWPAKKLLTAHPLGGCRMADSKKMGVVNNYGEVWNYPNLYIADGSIIPTPLSVNPSMTIAALAERIAEHIVK